MNTPSPLPIASPLQHRRRGAFLGGLALACVLAASACGSSSTTHTAKPAANLGLVTPGTIQAATQNDQYPFAFVGSNGQLQGFSIALVDDIAKRLDLKVNFKALSLDGLLSGIEAHQYDIGAVGLSETAAREQALSFSEPFYYGYLGILEKKGAGITTTNLAGKSVAVVTGSTQIAYAQAHFPKAHLKEFPDETTALAALLGGNVDSFFLGGPDTLQYLKQNPTLQLAATIQTGSPNAFPSPKSEPKFTAAVNTALNALFKNGTYKALYKQWFTQPIPAQLIAEHPSL